MACQLLSQRAPEDVSAAVAPHSCAVVHYWSAEMTICTTGLTGLTLDWRIVLAHKPGLCQLTNKCLVYCLGTTKRQKLTNPPPTSYYLTPTPCSLKKM